MSMCLTVIYKILRHRILKELLVFIVGYLIMIVSLVKIKIYSLNIPFVLFYGSILLVSIQNLFSMSSEIVNIPVK